MSVTRFGADAAGRCALRVWPPGAPQGAPVVTVGVRDSQDEADALAEALDAFLAGRQPLVERIAELEAEREALVEARDRARAERRGLQERLRRACGERVGYALGECWAREAEGGVVWLLGDRAKGWGAYGFRYDSWAELAAVRPELRPVGCGVDEHGSYVVMREVALPGAAERAGGGS